MDFISLFKKRVMFFNFYNLVPKLLFLPIRAVFIFSLIYFTSFYVSHFHFVFVFSLPLCLFSCFVVFQIFICFDLYVFK